MGDETLVTTPEPSVAPKNNSKKPKVGLILLILLLLGSLGGGGYLYWSYSQQIKQLKSEIASIQKELDNCKEQEKTDESGTAGSDDLPVIIFSPGGAFTTAEKTEITTRMINPYKAWHRDQGETLVSLHVQEQADVSNQYIVHGIYQGEIFEGFLYGSTSATTQDWWFPECLDACEFTDTFRTTYPEVVDAATP